MKITKKTIISLALLLISLACLVTIAIAQYYDSPLKDCVWFGIAAEVLLIGYTVNENITIKRD